MEGRVTLSHPYYNIQGPKAGAVNIYAQIYLQAPAE